MVLADSAQILWLSNLMIVPHLMIDVASTYNMSSTYDNQDFIWGPSAGRPYDCLTSDRDWSRLTGSDQDWPGLTGTDRDWPGLIRTDRYWPGLTGTDRNWPELTGTDRDWQSEVRTPIRCETIIRSDNHISFYLKSFSQKTLWLSQILWDDHKIWDNQKVGQPWYLFIRPSARQS